ncbi:hypothetical protein [Pseudostreptobacillus hongkongensis]|uniref:hypothetical protein n=1 Tax=Pseudostreptobacillus hongkongensis TaxID=1162717 RepID=UPI0028D39A03|nr:hypothetical protein [Pseudostreptobacillus hongkongensis]
MNENNSYVPRFLSNSVLRSKDLKEINRNINNSMYLEYTNIPEGIISGLNVTTDGEYISVNKGIYKYNDEIIFLDSTLKIEVPKIEKEYVLKLNSEIVEKEYSIMRRIYLAFDDEGFEVARFNFRQGANLENICYDNPKFNMKYNTLNVNEVLFSKTGISPKILQKWAQSMLDKKNITTWDLCVASLCYSLNINKELLIKYISKRLNLENKEYKNSEIIKHMYTILDMNNEMDEIEIESLKGISVD